MSANFNNSAWFYDRLSRLVYGRALINAQVYLLQFVPPDTNILIVGGGTGWILEELTQLQPSGLSITYVEVAAKMIARCKKRNTGCNKIYYINEAIENTIVSSNFDVVITPFLFDNFTDKNLPIILGRISKSLKPGGIWLNTSFQSTGKLWQAALLKLMFIFFKTLCGIEASKLPAIDQQFEKHGYKVIEERLFFRRFMVARVYKAG